MSSRLPPGKQWTSHNGKSAKLRRLRQQWRQVLKLQDPSSIEVRERLLEMANGHEEDAYQASFIAQRTALAIGSSWADVMERMLDAIEHEGAAE